MGSEVDYARGRYHHLAHPWHSKGTISVIYVRGYLSLKVYLIIRENGERMRLGFLLLCSPRIRDLVPTYHSLEDEELKLCNSE